METHVKRVACCFEPLDMGGGGPFPLTAGLVGGGCDHDTTLVHFQVKILRRG